MKDLVIKRLLRRSGKDGKGVYVVYFRFQLVWDGTRYPYFESSAKISIESPKEQWDFEAQKIRGTTDAARRLNQDVRKKEKAVEDFFDEYRVKTKKNFDFNRFKNLVNAQMGGKHAEKYDVRDEIYIPDLFDLHIASGKPKGGDYSEARARRYEFLKEQVSEYCKLKFRSEKVSLDRLGKSFYCGFRRYIQKKLSLKQNTLQGYMKVFSAAVKSEWERGEYTTKNPFSGCETDGGKARRIALSYSEFKAVEELADEQLGESVAMARDLFRLQTYSGISFGDTQVLTKDYILVLEGEHYLVKDREKNLHHANSNFFSVPITPAIKELLIKFSEHPKVKGTNRLIPPISNSDYNKHLKIIQAYAGIRKNLSSHIGRHTFSCLFLEAGGSMEVLMKLLGHSRLSQTQVYGKITPSRVNKEVRDALHYISNRDTKVIPISAAKKDSEDGSIKASG